MNDLQTINDIISNAVKSSSYISVLISSGVFIIYTIIIKAVDLAKSKNRNKPIIEMAAAIKEVSENVVKLNSVLDRTFRAAELKEIQTIKNIISLSCESLKFDVIQYCQSIIIHNNIEESRGLITQNIQKFVSTEYYKLYSLLSAYEYKDVNVSTKLKEEWIDELVKECIDIIYDNCDKVTRVSQLNSKIQVIVNDYSVYIMNKIFNH